MTNLTYPKNKSILLKGKLKDNIFTFDLGAVEKDIDGQFSVWEMCIASVTLKFDTTPQELILGLSINFVSKSKYVNVFSTQGQQKMQTIYFPSHWFEFDFVSGDLVASLDNLETSQKLVTAENADCYILLLYHRKS